MYSSSQLSSTNRHASSRPAKLKNENKQRKYKENLYIWIFITFFLFVYLTVFVFLFLFFLSVLTRFNWSRTALSETSNGYSRIGKLDKNETIWVSIKKCGNIQGRSTQINLGMGLKHRGDIRLQILLFRLLKDRLIQLFSPQYNKNTDVCGSSTGNARWHSRFAGIICFLHYTVHNLYHDLTGKYLICFHSLISFLSQSSLFCWDT